jgi:hypothetical protein
METRAGQFRNIYVAFLKLNGRKPASVEKLLEGSPYEKADFRRHYSGLRELETDLWQNFISETLKIVQEDPHFLEYGLAEKHLAFLFTFTEVLRPEKDNIRILLKGQAWPLMIAYLYPVKSSLVEIAAFWPEGDELAVSGLAGISGSAYAEGLWQQTLTVLNFWLSDESEEGQDTDAYIEKSTSLFFRLTDFSGFYDMVDFGKFLASRSQILSWFKSFK